MLPNPFRVLKEASQQIGQMMQNPSFREGNRWLRIIGLLSGNSIWETHGLTSETVVRRATRVWLFLSVPLMAQLIFINFVLRSDGGKADAEAVASTLLFWIGSFGGIYAWFRSEFVSKYSKLDDRLHDLILNPGSAFHYHIAESFFDDKQFEVSTIALCWAEDCVQYHLNKQRNFEFAFNHIFSLYVEQIDRTNSEDDWHSAFPSLLEYYDKLGSKDRRTSKNHAAFWIGKARIKFIRKQQEGVQSIGKFGSTGSED